MNSDGKARILARLRSRSNAEQSGAGAPAPTPLGGNATQHDPANPDSTNPDSANPPTRTLAPRQTDAGELVVDSADLFGASKQIFIRHGDAVYRMRITRNGKLLMHT